MKDAGERRDGAGAEIVCAWCGCMIRRGAAKAAKRMCQPCFARMMREHGREHRQDAARQHASDR